MTKLLVKAMAIIGALVAASSTGASWIGWFDEPTMPKSLLK